MSLPPALVQRFLVHLAGVRDELSGLRAALTTQDDEGVAARERLRSLCHQLAGTAGGYGFPAVGECARAVEGFVTASDVRLGEDADRLFEALADAVRNGAN